MGERVLSCLPACLLACLPACLPIVWQIMSVVQHACLSVCCRTHLWLVQQKSSGDARADALAEADEEMARRLQSKMDAQVCMCF